MKRALITGITGQVGSYLTELLLGKGYEVHGIIRRSSSFNTKRIEHLYQEPQDPERRLFLHYGDLQDSGSLQKILEQSNPDEVYNLGAQSHVKVSEDIPDYTGDVTGLGAGRVLEAIHCLGLDCRFYQASSSELFGNAPPPQSEETPFQPHSPYACAKLYAYWLTRWYREAHGMFAVNGILFNTESERRGSTFVTRKVTRATAAIKQGRQDKLHLGNLTAKRDWGYAGDYVEAIWLMLQEEDPDDFVVGTGETHSVRELCEIAFEHVGLDWQEHVIVDPRYLRLVEVDELRADASKARRVLGWQPRVKFREIIHRMVEHDLTTPP